LVGKPEEEAHLENTGIDWRIILKCVLKRNGGMGWVWLSTGKDGGFL
jgi:hypothetical protein